MRAVPALPAHLLEPRCRRSRQQPINVIRISPVEGERPPRGESRPERSNAIEVSCDQLACIIARKRFDPDRARNRDHREIKPIGAR